MPASVPLGVVPGQTDTRTCSEAVPTPEGIEASLGTRRKPPYPVFTRKREVIQQQH